MDYSTGQGPVDKGEVKSIIERQRKEKKDRLYIVVDEEHSRVIVGGAIGLAIKNGDTVIILEDEFKSSYDCKTCDGTGEVIKNCLKCDGSGKGGGITTVEHGINKTSYSECNKCDGKGSWLIPCTDCNGKGALLEIPDQAKARPTSGKIVAVGPDVKFSAIYDRVAYSGYTGHLIPFKGNTRLRIMREIEYFCHIEEIQGAKQEGEKIEFVDKDTAYDLT